MSDQKILKKPLTRVGKDALADEHEYLARTLRPKVLDGIQTAAAEGDRSENAEYIYGKKRLREIDRRISYLNRILTDAQILDFPCESLTKVGFGSTVEVLMNGEKKKSWVIVGEGEADLVEKGISWRSPVGKALLGKEVGEFVEVEVPAGMIELEILAAKYDRLQVVPQKNKWGASQ